MYNSGYSSADAGGAIFALIFSGFFFIIWLAVLILVIGGMWKVFTKAGKPGWAAIIPVYNIYVLTEVVGRPAWWVLLPFAAVVPVIGWIVAFGAEIILLNDLSKSYGKDVGFTIGLVILPFIFIPMLGWGPAQYVGPMATGFGLPDTPGGGYGGGYPPAGPGGYTPAGPGGYTPPPAPPAPTYQPPAPTYQPPAPTYQPPAPTYAPPASPAPPAAPAAPVAPEYTPPAAPQAPPTTPAAPTYEPPAAPPAPPTTQGPPA